MRHWQDRKGRKDKLAVPSQRSARVVSQYIRKQKQIPTVLTFANMEICLCRNKNVMDNCYLLCKSEGLFWIIIKKILSNQLWKYAMGKKCLHFNKLPFTFNRKGYVMIYHINETLLHNHIFMALRCLLNDAPFIFLSRRKRVHRTDSMGFSLLPVVKSFKSCQQPQKSSSKYHHWLEYRHRLVYF